jgi:hypothetical protein
MSGPALVFEGEEAMITAISENPANFKVPLFYSSIEALQIALLLIARGIFLVPWSNSGVLVTNYFIAMILTTGKSSSDPWRRTKRWARDA